MTSKASTNALLVTGGVFVAAAVWAGAFFLPAPSAQGPAPEATRPVPTAPAAIPLTAEAAKPVTLVEAAPARALAPLGADKVQPEPPQAAPHKPVDLAAFGGLPASLTPAAPAPPSRASLIDGAKALSLASTSLNATPLQSIGSSFSDPAAGVALPELGGAAFLDGPADAGLDVAVAKADLPDPQVTPPTGKIIVIDASEGTKLDPLRHRNWDLNAVQVIPPTVTTPKR